MNNIKSIFPYEQIYQERKKERERLQQCEKKRESGGCKFVGAGDNFSLAGELIKEALHKNYEVIHSIKALHLDCYVYLH